MNEPPGFGWMFLFLGLVIAGIGLRTPRPE